MSKYQRSLGVVLLSMALLLLNACSKAFNAEPEKVNAIKSVAVVSFTVPAFVAEEEGGLLSGLSAMAELVSDLVSGEERLGNGEQVANQAVVGFIEGMSESGRWNIVPANKVSSNETINAMVKTHGVDDVKSRMSMTGTPAIDLELGGGKSEYAAKAARALGVDGVMILSAYEMSYFLYTGTASTGQAKAKASGVFTFYDKQGNSIWESGAVTWTDDSAAMVAGAIDPSAADGLHKSIGKGFAKDILKTYAENAK